MKYLITLIIACCTILLYACENHKTVQHADLPEGHVVSKEMYSVQKYELVIKTPQGLERVEVDLDFYNYIMQNDTIVQPY